MKNSVLQKRTSLGYLKGAHEIRIWPFFITLHSIEAISWRMTRRQLF